MPTSSFSTVVLPVKETFYTTGLSHISHPTSTMFACVVTTLITPGGIPARLGSWKVAGCQESYDVSPAT